MNIDKINEIKQGVKKYYTIRKDSLYNEYEKKCVKHNNNSDFSKLLKAVGDLKFVNELENLVNDYLKNDGKELISIEEDKNFNQYLLDILGIKLEASSNDKKQQELINKEYQNSVQELETEYRDVLIAIDLCTDETKISEEVLKPYGLIDKKTNKLAF